MPRHVVATAHKVPCIGRKIDVELRCVVLNARLVERREPRRGGFAVFCQLVAEIHPGVEIVDAVGGGGVPKHARADFTVPAERLNLVAPVEAQIDGGSFRDSVKIVRFRALHPEVVLPGKRAEVHPVAGPNAPIQFGVEVVEVIRWVGAYTWVVARRCGNDGTQQNVEVGPAGADHETGFVLHNRAFQGQLRGDDADVAVRVKFPHVSVLHVDLQDGRQAPTISRGEAAFGDAHAFDRIRIEHAEKPKQVAHVVQRDAVQQHEVLVWGSATDVEPAGPFSPRLDPRKQLKRLEQVHLAANGRQRFDLVNRDFHPRHLHLLLNAVLLLASHNRLTQFQPCRQLHIELDVVGSQVDLKPLRGVADVIDAHVVRACRQGQGVKAVEVGRHALAHRLGPHRGPDERFARGGVGDVPAQGVAGLGPNAPHEEHPARQPHKMCLLHAVQKCTNLDICAWIRCRRLCWVPP